MKPTMRETILLGAGASVEAGIPGAFDMTRKIVDIFRDSPDHTIHSRVLSFVIGGLLFKRGMEGENPLTSGVNVEELFNAVQLLAERGRLEASPFVGSWHAVVDELDQIDPPEVSFSAIHRALQIGVAEQLKAAIPDIKRNFEGGYNGLPEAVGKYLSDYIRRWTEQLRNTVTQNPATGARVEQISKSKP